jgi:hypothetical protein
VIEHTIHAWSWYGCRKVLATLNGEHCLCTRAMYHLGIDRPGVYALWLSDIAEEDADQYDNVISVRPVYTRIYRPWVNMEVWPYDGHGCSMTLKQALATFGMENPKGLYAWKIKRVAPWPKRRKLGDLF